jgi:hypothetical protein
MSTTIGITVGSEAVGSVRFLDQLGAKPIAAGFELTLNIEITLRPRTGQNRFPMLTGLRAILTEPRHSLEIGRPGSDQIYTGILLDAPSTLRWSGSMATLSVYEKLRDSDKPAFRVALMGEVTFMREEGVLKPDSAPQTFQGYETVAYSTDTWGRALRTIGVSDFVMVQIPLPIGAPNGWEEVWKELSYAKAALERGGTTAWRDGALAVRRALEEWKKIEPENTAHNKSLKTRSKLERFDDLRVHLKNFADMPVHTGVEDWSRDDVVLMIATLTGLIAARNP